VLQHLPTAEYKDVAGAGRKATISAIVTRQDYRLKKRSLKVEGYHGGATVALAQQWEVMRDAMESGQ